MLYATAADLADVVWTSGGLQRWKVQFIQPRHTPMPSPQSWGCTQKNDETQEKKRPRKNILHSKHQTWNVVDPTKVFMTCDAATGHALYDACAIKLGASVGLRGGKGERPRW